jgi:NADH:ubiquinone oxidoreductase subunit F (NADH-binding)/(2Fe-2S) ferredoxin/NAD-dependent dihydropyrimidine dehydrogenase PreA subunit
MAIKTILVSQGTCCKSAGAEQVYAALEKELSGAGLEVLMKTPGCHGFSEIDPVVVIEPEGILYARVKVEDVPEIVRSLGAESQPVERLYYRDPVTGQGIPYQRDIPFFKKQQRTILKNCGVLDPRDIEDYLEAGGYQAVQKALREMTAAQVVAEVNRSGIRGLGGAGFPTGKKWEMCASAPGEIKYVICNADEGDPGSFQDRSILEGDPHAVLEGLILAGYAVGAQTGYLYVRAEYPLAIKNLQAAIDQAKEKGFIGQNILGKSFDFEIKIFQGAGAFVCGEETALIQSLEGRRGMPRPRPPYPVMAGLHGRPTLIDNVKTLASIRWIINMGAGWLAARGTETSKGTAVFSITGKVANCGLVEVPMGITMREIIYEIGGGIPGEKDFKAVQTGGPSGGCLPEDLLDTAIDFDTLRAAGSMMGSGGMVVMDEDTCMVDTARYFLDFSLKESCGQCAPCRLGTMQMHEILTRITQGEGKLSDLDLLVEVSEGVAHGSLCGLGKTAPNPVLTTLHYFRAEYEAHIKEKRCPARSCKALISYRINPDKCKGCSRCIKTCPVDAISGARKAGHFIDQSRCTKCGVCHEVCPDLFGAVECR